MTLRSIFRDVFSVACAVTVATLAASGVPLTERQALDRLSVWMDGHLVMGCAAGRAVASTVRFPESGGAYSVYVVTFSPAGYAVLNSDDRLPLTVAFSASSGVSLADRPDNAFRAALLSHVEKAARTLSGMDEKTAPDLSYRRAAGRAPLSAEQYGPYLTTSWNQCNPYNLACPADPDGNEYYRFRAPTGCTPAAYAQVLYYHRWPIRGEGTHGYTDSDGSITGAHSVSFGAPFGWAAMRTSYDPWAVSQPGEAEVADLMYRLGVAADADYESGGTGSSIQTLGSRINMHLYYEPVAYAGSQAALLTDLNDSLRAGYPAVVSIPGHAVAADGLLDDGGAVSYHINYGWGGQNDGWFSANNVYGSPIIEGCTAIRPMLMAFPAEQTVEAAAGDPVTLEWLLPVRREQEAERILIQRLTAQGGTWSSGAETLEHAVPSGWQLSPSGRSGPCWFAGPNGYKALTLTDLFVPDASASLTFWLKYQLVSAAFRVAVSGDSGETYTTLLEKNNNYQSSFQYQTVGLGAYAGQQIRIRFELTWGSAHYPEGGVWLDDLNVTSGAWSRWMPFAEDATLASRPDSEQPVHFTVLTDTLEAGSYTLASVVKDTNGVSHTRSPAFSITINPSAVSLPTALDAAELTFTTGGSVVWLGQTATTHDGADAAQSGVIGHSQTSYMETTVFGPGTVSFWWKVSSEGNYDLLRFYIDGTVQEEGAISGSVDWQQKSYTIPSGSHTLKWQYSKDGSVSAGSDCGWVDQVVWTPSTGYTLTVHSSNPDSGVAITSTTGHGGTTRYTKTVAAGETINLQAPEYVGSGASRKRFVSWDSNCSVDDPIKNHTFQYDTLCGDENGNMWICANYADDPEGLSGGGETGDGGGGETGDGGGGETGGSGETGDGGGETGDGGGYLCDPAGDAALATVGAYDGYLYAAEAFGGGEASAVRGTLSLKVTGLAGKLTAKAVLQGGSVSFKGAAWKGGEEPDGTRHAELDAAGGERLDLFVRQNRIWGTLSGGKAGAAGLTLDGARNRFAESGDTAAAALLDAFKGYYTVALPAAEGGTLSASDAVDAAPQGAGYLTVTVGAKGSAKIAGVLADGTKVTQAGRLLLFDGCGTAACVPFFAPLYTKKGWAGGLLWIDPETRTVKTDRDIGWFIRWENPGRSGPDSFSLLLDACGGFYGTGASLASAYLFGAETEGTVYFDALGEPRDWSVLPETVPVTAAGASLSVAKGAKPKKFSEEGEVWYEYDEVNPANVTLTFASRTGLFKGKFNLYCDYEDATGKVVHKAVSVPYAGVLTPVRGGAFDGLPAGLGHCLIPDSDPAAKAYRLKRSRPVWLEEQ